MIKDSILYLFGRVLGAVIGFATVFVITRMVTPESYGKYALFMSYTMIVYGCFFHWITAVIFRYFSKENKTTILYSKVLFVLFLSILFLSFVIIWLVSWLTPFSTEYLLLLLLSSVATLWTRLVLEIAQINTQPVKFGIISIVKSILILIFSILLVMMGFDVYGLIGAYILGNIIGVFRFDISALKQYFGFFTSEFGPLAKEILRYGLPFSIHVVLLQIVLAADKIFLGYYTNVRLVGVYSAVTDIMWPIVSLLMLSIASAFRPIVIRAFDRESKSIDISIFTQAFNLLLLIAVPILGVTIMMYPELGMVILGPNYIEEGVSLIPWVSVAAVIYGFQMAYFETFFIVTKKSKYMVFVAALMGLFSFASSLVVVPKYELMGVVTVKIMAMILGVISCYLVVHWRICKWPIKFDSETVKISVAGLLFVILLYCGGNIIPSTSIVHFVLVVVSSSLFYIMFLYFMNVFYFKQKIHRFFDEKKQSFD